MLSIALNKGDFCETHIAYRLALIHSTSNLQCKLKNVIFRHHYVMRKTAVVLKLSDVTFAEFLTSTAKI